MRFLCDARLLERTYPSEWGPILDDLRSFGELLDLLPSSPAGASEAACAQARARHGGIMAKAASIAEALSSKLAPGTPDHRLALAQAVILWMSYAQTGGRIAVDTLRCRTLREFPIDLEPDDRARDILRAALSDLLHFTPEELSRQESELALLISNLEVKHALARAIVEIFECDRSPHALMRRIYGPLPFRPEDVDLVVTHSRIFFCLPYEGESLITPGFGERPGAERAAIQVFLHEVNHQNTLQTDRFPSFGYFDRSAVDPSLVDALKVKIRARPGLEGVRAEVVAETLATMVQLLPTHLADQYLIHDDWGHGWQEALCEFEWLHFKLACVTDPIKPTTGPLFGTDGTPRLIEAFETRDASTRLNERLLLEIVERDLRGRILAGLNGIFSEMLADLVEHKFFRYGRMPGERFPTSSLLPDQILKLDLTWFDARAHARLCWMAYQRLIEDRSERERLSAALLEAGLPEPGLEAGVDRAADLIARTFGDAPQAMVERVMLLAVALEHELGRFLADADRILVEQGLAGAPGRRWHCPIACIDLLVLVLAWFYEQDRTENLWQLPQLVRDALRPSMLGLGEAIGRAAERAGP